MWEATIPTDTPEWEKFKETLLAIDRKREQDRQINWYATVRENLIDALVGASEDLVRCFNDPEEIIKATKEVSVLMDALAKLMNADVLEKEGTMDALKGEQS
jgi:hypothetical protein